MYGIPNFKLHCTCTICTVYARNVYALYFRGSINFREFTVPIRIKIRNVYQGLSMNKHCIGAAKNLIILISWYVSVDKFDIFPIHFLISGRESSHCFATLAAPMHSGYQRFSTYNEKNTSTKTFSLYLSEYEIRYLRYVVRVHSSINTGLEKVKLFCIGLDRKVRNIHYLDR